MVRITGSAIDMNDNDANTQLQVGDVVIGRLNSSTSAPISVPNRASGTWNALVKFGASTGLTTLGGAGTATLGAGGWKAIPVIVDSTTYYMPACATITNT